MKITECGIAAYKKMLLSGDLDVKENENDSAYFEEIMTLLSNDKRELFGEQQLSFVEDVMEGNEDSTSSRMYSKEKVDKNKNISENAYMAVMQFARSQEPLQNEKSLFLEQERVELKNPDGERVELQNLDGERVELQNPDGERVELKTLDQKSAEHLEGIKMGEESNRKNTAEHAVFSERNSKSDHQSTGEESDRISDKGREEVENRHQQVSVSDDRKTHSHLFGKTEHSEIERLAADQSKKADPEEKVQSPETQQTWDVARGFESPESGKTLPEITVEKTEMVLHTSPQDLPQAVAKTVAKVDVQKDNHLEISLTPKTLGKITIKIKAGKEGSAVVIETSSQQAQNILNESASQLGGILEHYTGVSTEVILMNMPLEQDTQYKDQDRDEQSKKKDKKKKMIKIASDSGFSDRLRLGLIEKGETYARNTGNWI